MVTVEIISRDEISMIEPRINAVKQAIENIQAVLSVRKPKTPINNNEVEMTIIEGGRRKKDVITEEAVPSVGDSQSQRTTSEQMEEMDITEAFSREVDTKSHKVAPERRKRTAAVEAVPEENETDSQKKTSKKDEQRLVYHLYRLRFPHGEQTFEDFYLNLWKHYKLYHGEPITPAPPVSTCRWNINTSWWAFIAHTLMSENTQFRNFYMSVRKDHEYHEYRLYRHYHPKGGYPFEVFWLSLWWKFQDSMRKPLGPPPPDAQSAIPRDRELVKFLKAEVKYACKGIKIWRTSDKPAYRLYRFQHPKEKKTYHQFYAEQWQEFLKLIKWQSMPVPAEETKSPEYTQFSKFLKQKLKKACDAYEVIGGRLYYYLYPNQECTMDEFYQQKWDEYRKSYNEHPTPGPTVKTVWRSSLDFQMRFIEDETRYVCDNEHIWFERSTEARPVYRIYRYLHPGQCIPYYDFYCEKWKMYLELSAARPPRSLDPGINETNVWTGFMSTTTICLSQTTQSTINTLNNSFKGLKEPPVETSFAYHMSGFHVFMMNSLEKFYKEFEKELKAERDPEMWKAHRKCVHHCRPIVREGIEIRVGDRTSGTTQEHLPTTLETLSEGLVALPPEDAV